MPFALGPKSRAAGTQLYAFDQIGSTNAEALSRAREGTRGPAWFVTTEQTAGRGRRSRPWQAARGNLASSILQTLDVSPSTAATLGFAAGLAIEQALRTVSLEAAARGAAMPDYRLKWPNDVLADGRKLCGILLEAEATSHGLAVVVGIGTNVVSAPTDTPYPATSLAALGITAGAEDLFAALSDTWSYFVALWDNGRGFGDIRKLWLVRAAGLDAPVSIRSGGGVIEGMFDTIDESGCMIVRDGAGRRVPITAGDVHFGAAASAGAA